MTLLRRPTDPATSADRETRVPTTRGLRAVDVVVLVGLALWLVYRVVVALAAIGPFSGGLADGPFQLFDALRRIEDGQTIGRDFQFFHGVGIAYLHAPLYLALGGGLYASEVARQVLPVLVVAVATFCALRLLDLRTRTALRATLVALVLSEMFVPVLIEPGNSLLSIRSGVAVILLLPIAWAIGRARHGWHPAVGGLVVGALAGAVFAVVTDQGLAVLVGTAVAVVVAFWGRLRALLLLAPTFAVGVLASFFLLLLVLIRSVEGATGAMRYALVDVPGDQFWYFGTPPNGFLRGFGDLFTDRIVMSAVALLALCVLGVALARRHLPPGYVPRVTLLLAYGTASMAPYLGMTYNGYIAPAFRVVFLVAISLVALTWHVWRPAHLTARVALVTATVVAVGSFAQVVWRDIGGRGPVQVVALADRGLDGFRTLVADGPELNEFWSDYVAATTADEEWAPCEAWYLYAGLAQAEADCFGVQTYDYVIHALGGERDDYLEDFRRMQPRFVETIQPRPFHYEEWVRTTTWPLYQELLEHYEPFRATPYTLLWRRVEDNGVRLVAQGELERQGDALVLQPPDVRLQVVTVEVEYDVVGTSTPTTRLLATPSGTRFALPLPVSPHETSASFPLFPLYDPVPVSFTTEGTGLGNLRTWEVTSGTWAAYEVPDTWEWRLFLAAEDA